MMFLLCLVLAASDPSLPALNSYHEVAQFVNNTGKPVKVSFGAAYHTAAADYSFASWPARCPDGLYVLKKTDAGELYLYPEQQAQPVRVYPPAPSSCPNGRCPLQR